MVPFSVSRREFAAALAAPALLAEGGIDRELVERHDAAVDRLLKLQIVDKAHPECGGYGDEFGLYGAGTGGGLVDAFIAAWGYKGSRHYHSAVLQERMLLAAQYLMGKQHEDGTIDLLVTNFHSTPDVAFVIHGVAEAAWLAREFKNEAVAAALAPFVKRAGEALARGGVHTPNHRWVVCEALAQVNELYPDAKYTARIAQWLAEGIDIDADGQYNERSTTVYNPVTDRALVVVAMKTGRPELLEPVRRNLRSMLYLLHPGGEVVTEISRRQDQYNRGGMERYWLPLRYLAILDGDGQFAEMVRRIEGKGASLSAYLRYPELLKRLPASSALPEDFHKLMPVLAIARVRRGKMSASVMMNGNSRFFTMRNGDCVIEAVRFASAFFGKGQFLPERFEQVEGGYRMTQTMTAPYYQPLEPPRVVDAAAWGSLRGQRRQSEVQTMTYTVVVRERAKGFTVEIVAEGTPKVPLAVEITLREGTRVEGVDGVLLKSGFATARVGRDAIRFGPGFGEHAYTQVRGAEAKLAGTGVYLCGFTPLRKVIEFDVVA
ncbi:MAG TPA: hypothetical protein VGK29_08170 [Paludibaculum sp.]|jgi:hypothetical protein